MRRILLVFCLSSVFLAKAQKIEDYYEILPRDSFGFTEYVVKKAMFNQCYNDTSKWVSLSPCIFDNNGVKQIQGIWGFTYGFKAIDTLIYIQTAKRVIALKECEPSKLWKFEDTKLYVPVGGNLTLKDLKDDKLYRVILDGKSFAPNIVEMSFFKDVLNLFKNLTEEWY